MDSFGCFEVEEESRFEESDLARSDGLGQELASIRGIEMEREPRSPRNNAAPELLLRLL